jgi:hypothetical protein
MAILQVSMRHREIGILGGCQLAGMDVCAL